MKEVRSRIISSRASRSRGLPAPADLHTLPRRQAHTLPDTAQTSPYPLLHVPSLRLPRGLNPSQNIHACRLGCCRTGSLILLVIIAYHCRGSEAMNLLLGVRVAKLGDRSKLAIAWRTSTIYYARFHPAGRSFRPGLPPF